MDEYTFFRILIHTLYRSDVFTNELIFKLSEELEDAYKDGRLDKDLDLDLENTLFTELELFSNH